MPKVFEFEKAPKPSKSVIYSEQWLVTFEAMDEDQCWHNYSKMFVTCNKGESAYKAVLNYAKQFGKAIKIQYQ